MRQSPDAQIEALYNGFGAGLECRQESERLFQQWRDSSEHQKLVALGVMLRELIDLGILGADQQRVVVSEFEQIVGFYGDLESIAQQARKALGTNNPGVVFICYAHADNSPERRNERWLDQLLEFLGPLEREGRISLFCDIRLARPDPRTAQTSKSCSALCIPELRLYC